MELWELFDAPLWAEMMAAGYIREQRHPTLPLAILNYTEKAAYEGVWNDVTLQCRGLIYRVHPDRSPELVARPFPKFFNYGQGGAPEVNLFAPAVVTDKLDGSLGILYPMPEGYAVATRGSFTSEQALHATDIWRDRYEGRWLPIIGCTHLFEIVYPSNRIVCDYGDIDDLVYLETIEIDTGWPVSHETGYDWPGPRAEVTRHLSLTDALTAEPRENVEGYVVWFPDTNDRVKIKQDDYVTLHRILTGTNARHIWEVTAVHSCSHLITEPKHWGSYLGIDPARAAEVQALGDDWLAGVPDEFYAWVHRVQSTAERHAQNAYAYGCDIAERARAITDRSERYVWLSKLAPDFITQTMRLASSGTAEGVAESLGGLWLRCWREACPDPTAPFQRTEDVA